MSNKRLIEIDDDNQKSVKKTKPNVSIIDTSSDSDDDSVSNNDDSIGHYTDTDLDIDDDDEHEKEEMKDEDDTSINLLCDMKDIYDDFAKLNLLILNKDTKIYIPNDIVANHIFNSIYIDILDLKEYNKYRIINKTFYAFITMRFKRPKYDAVRLLCKGVSYWDTWQHDTWGYSPSLEDIYYMVNHNAKTFQSKMPIVYIFIKRSTDKYVEEFMKTHIRTTEMKDKYKSRSTEQVKYINVFIDMITGASNFNKFQRDIAIGYKNNIEKLKIDAKEYFDKKYPKPDTNSNSRNKKNSRSKK